MNGALFNVDYSDLRGGRYVKATRDISPGELILKEEALLVGGPVSGTHQCFKCSKKLTKDIYVCARCCVATLCGKECKGLRHKRPECDALKASKLKAADVVKNSQIAMPFRCLIMRDCDQEAWKTLIQLDPHLEARKDSFVWEAHEIFVEKVLNDIGALTKEDLKEEIVQKVCGILDVYSFEANPLNDDDSEPDPSESMRAFYLQAALIPHNCVSNTILTVDEEFILTVHSAAFIKEGEPIYFNYASSIMGTYDRKQYLKEGKYIECACKRCADPSELGSFMSSLYCPSCKSGLLIPQEPLADTYNTTWKCVSCNEATTGKTVQGIVEECKEYFSAGCDSTQKVESFLSKFSSKLPPQHFLMLDLKHTLITFYKNSESSQEELHRKQELCQELIRSLKLVEPQISRLQATILHELSATKLAQADKELNNQEITEEKYLEEVQEAETILKQSVNMLIYEPTKTPEGRLFQQALTELKAIRSTLVEFTKLNST